MSAAAMVRRDPTRAEPPARRCSPFQHVGGLDTSGEVGSLPTDCLVHGEPVNDAVCGAIHRPSKKCMSPGVSSRGASPL
ncbi:hypothetical protein CMUS01_12027 [Colletotrichum musicola]|uniref:Uncharacterized protein n=1 Tax=Colletotrichum musicola TaxID=2175873 RepID=A0A8H6JS91_9PEZI|nr:hypothetical protein CMUS01_12027 [Colletotrichum musicola]